MTGNPVGWFEIYVQDMERAKAFYQAVFEVQLARIDTPAPDMELWGFPMAMDRWGAGGALAKMKDVSSGGNSTIVYFSCEDCAVQAARAASSGGEIVKQKMSIGQYGFIALVRDSEYNMIGLHSLK